MTTKEQIIKNSPLKPKLVKVTDYVKETEDSFTIRLDWQLEHEPGQFVFCSLPGIGEAPISICSFSNKYIELNIRMVGNVTNALSKIKKGDWLLVRGPYGKSYPMEEFRGKTVIIVGGGCGVAPLRGAVEFVEKHRDEFHEVYLFFGFRTPDDTLFRNKLEMWKKIFHMKVSFDNVKDSKTCFDGKQGFVTQLLDEHIHHSHNKVVFICGPPIMIQKSAELLMGKGFLEEQIYISAERLMYCGLGKCGRCMIHGKYTCLDGAVFRYDELKDYHDD